MSQIRCANKSRKCCTMISTIILVIGAGVLFVIGACWALRIRAIVDIFGGHNSLLATVFIGGGMCAMILGFMATWGSATETLWMLVVFALTTILMLIGEIACAILVLMKISWVDKYLSNSWPRKFQWHFLLVLGVIGLVQIVALVFVCLLIKNIKLCRALRALA